MKKKKNSILKSTIQLTIFAFLAKGLGFIREIVLANYFGASAVSDVFVAVQNIPAVIFSVFGIAVTTGFIPLYTEIRTKKNINEAENFTNNIFNIFLIISIILSILGIIFSKQFVYIFAGGFPKDTFNLCNKFTKIVFPTCIAIILVYVYNAYLQINGFFNQNSLMNIPYNIVLIISIILGFYAKNYYFLAFGLLIASFSQLVYLKILMIKNTEFKHTKYLKINDKLIIRMIILVGPMFISTGVSQINAIVDRSLASSLTEGSISALNYSNEIVSIGSQVIISSLITIIYPSMATLFSKDNSENEKCEFVERYINIVSLIVFPLALLLFLFANEIVDILFGRGAFNKDTVIFVARSLKIYALGIIGSSFRDVINKVFYSMKNTMLPMINGIITVLLNIILNLLLINKFKYLGLAFATSISVTIGTIILFLQMRKKLNKISIKNILSELFKIIIAIICMGIVIWFCNFFDFIKIEILKCIIYGILSIFTYIIVLIILKENLIIEFISRLKNKKFYKNKSIL